jgi:hypothetical protein
LFWLNFIIPSATFIVADLIFAKTKYIQKARKKQTLCSSTSLGASVEAHPNFGGQREVS